MFFFWLVTVALLVMVERSIATPLEHWGVRISNDMQSKQTLFLHCKSKDDDLGRLNLGFAQSFSWRFKVNLWQTTLYWCYMRKKEPNHIALEVFWPESISKSWLSHRCQGNRCFWSVRDDGIYVKNIPENKFELHAKWLPGW